MKISVDGGALCTDENQRFGTYSFIKSFIEAIQKYDQDNEYYVYSFCPKPAWISTDNKLHYQFLKPKSLWLSTRVSLEEFRHRKDIFLALNQAIPHYTSNQIISFSHGLSFYFYPQYYPDSYHALKDQLDPMVKKSQYVVVSSLRVKKELKKIYPNYGKFIVNCYGVPFDMLEDKLKVKSQKIKVNKKFFLYVGMDHPVKNIDFLVKLFKQFRKNKQYIDYKLFLVGNLDKFTDKASNIFSYSNISRKQLRRLYEEATAYLSASFYESFNFPVLEALSQQCPIIGLREAIIPEFSGYVSLADNIDEFIKYMEESTNQRKIQNYKNEILARFSWKKYILKLKELYKGQL